VRESFDIELVLSFDSRDYLEVSKQTKTS
jgi:hypothetical protein